MTELDDNSVQMCVTSPPYWGLRKYAGLPDLIWGGDPNCGHQWISQIKRGISGGKGNAYAEKLKIKGVENYLETPDSFNAFCSLCGGWKGAYGLEPTPEMYVQHTIEILREIKRVLRKDGVVFWNIGDSYAGSNSDKGDYRAKKGLQKDIYDWEHPQANTGKWDKWRRGIGGEEHGVSLSGIPIPLNLKPKDLCLIPFRVAIAAQEPYQEFTIKELADRAWLAGIIDGEGCIGIHHMERKDRGSHYHQFQPFISVGSIDPPLIERIVRITRMNGTRQTTEPGDVDGRGIITRHANYEWRVEGTNAIKVIEDVFPNLTIKRKQAKIAYELAKCHTPHTGKGHKVPTDITTHKLMLWQMIKDCNQRKEVDVNLPEVPQHIEPGWWVRSVIIWSKNNPMPESVTDRPTESHEYILLLTKNSKYYWDAEAVREPQQPSSFERRQYDTGWNAKSILAEDEKGRPFTGVPRIRGYKTKHFTAFGEQEQFHGQDIESLGGRNIRSVWEFPTQPYPKAHFAVFPEKLPELCIKAATPEVGCCSKCGVPWVRIINRVSKSKSYATGKSEVKRGDGLATAFSGYDDGSSCPQFETLGWQPSCSHTDAPKIGSIVLDPFAGSGTTLWVAAKLGRRAVGYELSKEYCDLCIDRCRQLVL